MRGWRRLAGMLTPHHSIASFAALTVGERYVCDLDGRGRRLRDFILADLEEWVDSTGEGALHCGATAILEGADGARVMLPRSQVLWASDDHSAIVAATASLDLPLVPATRRPGPIWRLRSARIETAGMVAFGRLVMLGR